MRLVFVILVTFFSVESYEILWIYTSSAYSHFVVFKPLIGALSQKGHNLTVMGFFPSSRKLENCRDVALKLEEGGHGANPGFQDEIGNRELDRYFRCYTIMNYSKATCKSVLASEEYRDECYSDKKYDLIIAEFFATNCMLIPLIEKHNVPLIGVKSQVMLPWQSKWVGNPDNPAYIPDLFLGYSPVKNFSERLKSALLLLVNNVIFDYLESTIVKKIVKKYHPGDFEEFNAKLYSTSLILVNSHFTLNGARPLVPNVVEIGGVHIGTTERLPSHIDKWINESKHGVIYFSLGSMIKGHTFPDDKKQMFINAFGRLPQRVLWKWENETMPGKTDNIMIEKWMPQFDILCHPNVKAFIAHGGMLGVTEAVHCGVPMIIMPQFGDQFTNAKAVEASGGGTILDYRYLDEESIYNALTTALDPKSNKKAKELSARFKDRPLPPLETSIYWIEYVARHGGAPHLRTAAVGMPLYQYLLLDVIAFLVVILFSFLFVVYYISRAILRKLCRRKQSSQKKKKH
ncbi:UDP-glucuronosyltransferase 1-9-like isoform X3 [Photinus pyralis]|nr:UDP-glucuronosyltransferase 1-9-like isoform X3 [Photinus pyralis]